MKDIVERILHNKFIVFIGDSVVRTCYKDLVFFIRHGKYKMNLQDMKTKGEPSFSGDKLIEISEMTNGKLYREVRQYQTDYHLIRFYFATRVYSEYFETILQDLTDDLRPDVIIMNSCMWDVSRYGPRSMIDYQLNICKTFTRFKQFEFPCVIWLSGMPPGNELRGGLIVPEITFLNGRDVLFRQIQEGNCYAKQAVKEFDFLYMDTYTMFVTIAKLYRQPDGIHWNEDAHRRITAYILYEICLYSGIDPPPEINNIEHEFQKDKLARLHRASLSAPVSIDLSYYAHFRFGAYQSVVPEHTRRHSIPIRHRYQPY